MRISDWSSDVCSSDLRPEAGERNHDRSQHDEQPVGDRAFDDPGDHCPLACLIALMRALLSSCTQRKLTLSPRLKPRNWAGLLVANVIVIAGQPSPATGQDRQSGGEGKTGSGRVDHGGSRITKRKKHTNTKK